MSVNLTEDVKHQIQVANEQREQLQHLNDN